MPRPTKKQLIFDDFSTDVSMPGSNPPSTETDIAKEITAQETHDYPLCPNLFPRLNSTSSRIAIIGEAPGEAEVFHQIPFCPTPTPTNPKAGSSGRLLNDKLSHVRDIKQPGRSARGIMFGHNRRVLHRHRPPGEVDHPAAMSGVPIGQRRFCQSRDHRVDHRGNRRPSPAFSRCD